MSKKARIYFLIGLLLIIGILTPSTKVNAFDEDIFENFLNKSIPANSTNKFNFIPWNNELKISTNTFINFSYSFLSTIFSRFLSLKINETNSLTFNLDLRLDFSDFNIELPDFLGFNGTENLTDRISFNSIYRFIANESIDSIEFIFKENEFNNLDPNKNYSIAFKTIVEDSWIFLPTEEIYNSSLDTNFFKASLDNTKENETYYFTLIEIESKAVIPPLNLTWIWFIIIPGIIITIGIIIVISKEDYIKYLKTRIIDIEKGAHKLSLDEVLENKNRMKIIDLILNKPGIHFNELLRETKLAPGNLVWHLDILETYKIIGKKRISNYVVYIPFYQKNPLSNIDIKLQKSELTLEVLNVIEENPGIWNSKIASELDTHRKTIDYHVKKLLDLDLIYRKKEGFRMKIYPKLEKAYFNND